MSAAPADADARACPCGSGLPYGQCCGPLHRGARAATAEALMRSRYSAFALGDAGHLLATWHAATRPAQVDLDPARTWEGLEVLTTGDGGWLDAEGTVGFRARWRERGVRGVLREVSRFARDGGRWAYVGPAAGAQAP